MRTTRPLLFHIHQNSFIEEMAKNKNDLYNVYTAVHDVLSWHFFLLAWFPFSVPFYDNLTILCTSYTLAGYFLQKNLPKFHTFFPFCGLFAVCFVVDIPLCANLRSSPGQAGPVAVTTELVAAVDTQGNFLFCNSHSLPAQISS